MPSNIDTAETAGSPDRILLTHPLSRAVDLGKPIPATPHAASVAMPLWEHVIRYEQRDPALLDSLQCGYPRFVFNALVNELFQVCRRRFAKTGELCLALPSLRIANRCAQFMKETGGFDARIEDLGLNEIRVVLFAEEAFDCAKRYWQHYGDIISSRLAQATLDGRSGSYEDSPTKRALRDRIASITGITEENVYLYASGMAALSATLQTARAIRPGAKTIQIGLPYVDLLRIQTKWGPAGTFYADSDEKQFDAIAWQLENEPIAAVYCEVPGNPLLQTPDLEKLSALTRKHSVPLIIDETLGSFLNIDLRPYADLIVTSLTKYFSGVGDVMSGSVLLNQTSPLFESLQRHHAANYEDRFWEDDAAVLESNSRDFESRMQQMNRNAELLCEYLRKHPKVQHVYFPKYESTTQFVRVMRPGAGYGGLFSIVLKNGAEAAPKFYDALRVSKGPSLGTNFTLACPYIMLTHFDELDWVESLGVSPYLVRVSVGLEEASDLTQRFKEALDTV